MELSAEWHSGTWNHRYGASKVWLLTAGMIWSCLTYLMWIIHWMVFLCFDKNLSLGTKMILSLEWCPFFLDPKMTKTLKVVPFGNPLWLRKSSIPSGKMTHETLDHPPKFLDYLLTIKPPGGYIRDFTPEGFLMFITIVLISCLFFLFGLFCCLNLPWYRYTKVYTLSIITQLICPSLL